MSTEIDEQEPEIEDELEPKGGSEDIDEPGDDEPSPRGRYERRKNFTSARDLMTEELRLRAEHSSERLKACLTGTILIRVRDRGENFIFDWTGNSPRAEASKESTADCSIELNENTLLKIASGDLNPQIAMLSEKITVQGKLSLAVYFFNLLAPYPQQ